MTLKLLVLCTLLVAAFTGATDAAASYSAVVTVLPCRGERPSHIDVYMSTGLYSGRVLIGRFGNFKNALPVVRMSAPRNHRYLWIRGGDCEAMAASMSLGGESRNYVAVLLPGKREDVDRRDAFIAGKLPIVGVQSVSLVQESGMPRFSFPGVVDGQYYYIESPPAGRFRIQFILNDSQSALIEEFGWTFDRNKSTSPFHKIDNIDNGAFRRIDAYAL